MEEELEQEEAKESNQPKQNLKPKSSKEYQPRFVPYTQQAVEGVLDSETNKLVSVSIPQGFALILEDLRMIKQTLGEMLKD